MKQFLQIVFFLIPVAAFAQDYPLTGHLQNLDEKDIYHNEYSTLIRPATGAENELYDSLIFTTNKEPEKSWINRKLFHEHLLVQEDEKFKLLLDPILDFRVNKSIGTPIPSDIGYLNTRGVLLNGNLDSKIYFNTSFYENQGVFANHIGIYYDLFKVIPGYGRVKELSGYSEYDFAAAYGNISVKPNKYLNFTIGYDRLFIGDGYRSMILSDFAAPVMYFKTSVAFGKFEYNNIFTKALNPNYNNVSNHLEVTGINSRYPAKYISYNTLTYKVKNWQFSLIEALVMPEHLPKWQVGMTCLLPYIRGAAGNLFSEPVNNLSALNISWQAKKIGVFYAQVLIDKLYGKDKSDYAIQAGYKNFNLFNIKNLFVLAEWNMSSERTYAFSDNMMHYSHFNQPLAHPAGNDFQEFIFISAYSVNKFEFVAKFNLLKVGNQNIFDFYDTDGYFNYNFQNIKEPVIANADFQLIYNINKENNLQIFGSLSPCVDFIRNYSVTFVQFGLRTAIRSNNYDFK